MLTPAEVERRSMLLRSLPAREHKPRKRDRFEVMVDPDEVLSPRELHRRAEKVRSKHYRDLANKRWHPVTKCAKKR